MVALRHGAAGVPAQALPQDGETAAEAARTRQWREVCLGAQILKDLGVRARSGCCPRASTPMWGSAGSVSRLRRRRGWRGSVLRAVFGEHRLDLVRRCDLATPDCCKRFVDFAQLFACCAVGADSGFCFDINH